VTPTLVPYRSDQRAGRDGFLPLLHAEWTKYRTVRGWVISMVAAALTVVLVALLAGISSDQRGRPAVPIGPGGEPVTDSFYFVHQPLAGDGSITVSVSALTDSIGSGLGGLRPGIVPWAKAGLIITDSTRQGSPYAAIIVTRSPATTPPTARTGPRWTPFTWPGSDRGCKAGCSSPRRMPCRVSARSAAWPPPSSGISASGEAGVVVIGPVTR
jgi:hypothetical protein